MIDMDAPRAPQAAAPGELSFTPEAVRARAPRVARVCDDIIDAVCEHGECDLVSDVAAPLPWS